MRCTGLSVSPNYFSIFGELEVAPCCGIYADVRTYDDIITEGQNDTESGFKAYVKTPPITITTPLQRGGMARMGRRHSVVYADVRAFQ